MAKEKPTTYICKLEDGRYSWCNAEGSEFVDASTSCVFGVMGTVLGDTQDIEFSGTLQALGFNNKDTSVCLKAIDRLDSEQGVEMDIDTIKKIGSKIGVKVKVVLHKQPVFDDVNETDSNPHILTDSSAP